MFLSSTAPKVIAFPPLDSVTLVLPKRVALVHIVWAGSSRQGSGLDLALWVCEGNLIGQRAAGDSAGDTMTVSSLADAAQKSADSLAAPGVTAPFAPFEWMIDRG